MLKYAIILLVLVYFGESKISPSRFYRPETIDIIVNCGKKLGIRFEDFLENLEQNAGGLAMKQYNLCGYRSLGMITKDNQINQELVPKIIAIFFPENPEKIKKECLKRIRDPLNDTYEISVCIIRLANEV
uniref:Uncharacterized protein LOC114332633 n=1 Tax=Diabrotica virgifera virgifera TaxID=50390 RepID=A0A6P7FTX6_DIAVI